MIDTEQFTDLGVNARLSTTDGFDFGSRAAHLVHIGRRSTDIADGAFERFALTELLDFVQDTFLAARLNSAALMRRDRTERASTKAPRMIVTESLIISYAGIGSV